MAPCIITSRRSWILFLVCSLALSAMVGARAVTAVDHEPLLYTYPPEAYPDIGSINDILQTRDGVIWFAGRRGILEYDGVRFRRHSEPDGLQATYVYRLYESSDGELYACTWRGLHSFNHETGRWELYPVKDREPVRDLAFAPDGLIMSTDDGAVLVRNQGFYRIPIIDRNHDQDWIGPSYSVDYDSSAREIWIGSELHGLVRVPYDSLLAHLTWRDADAQAYFEANGFEAYLRDYGEPPDLLLQFARSDSIDRVEWERKYIRHYRTPGGSTHILGMAWPGGSAQGTGPLFVTVEGAFQVEGDGVRPAAELTARLGRHPHYLRGHAGGLHAASLAGAWSMSGQDTTWYDPEGPLDHSMVTSMFRDRDGILWLGTETGWIRKHVHPAITQWQLPGNSPLGSVTAAIQDGENAVLLIGMDGIARTDKEGFEILYTAREGESIVDAARDPWGNVLVATNQRLLVLKDGREQTLLSVSVANSIRNPFHVAGNGVWFTMDWRVHFWDGHRLSRKIRQENVLTINTVTEGPNGETYLGTWAGLLVHVPPLLYRHSFHQVARINLDDPDPSWESLVEYDDLPFPDESILTAKLAPDSTLWCGTLNGGILHFNNTGLHQEIPRGGQPPGSYTKSYRLSDGRILFFGAVVPLIVDEHGLHALRGINPLDAVIEYVNEDDQGRIYLTTSSGVLVLEADELRFIIGPSLGVSLGDLVGVYRLGRSRVCLVLTDRLVCFDMNRFLDDRSLPRHPVIRSLHDSDGRRLSGNPVELPSWGRSLRIEFALPFYLNEDMQRFSWRMEGLDEPARSFVSRGETSYDRLPPGEYVFHLRARDSIGRVTESVPPLSVVVPPRFYETGFFFVLIVLAAMGLVALIIWISVANIHRRNQALEEAIEERTRELLEALTQLEAGKKAEMESERLRVAQRMAVTVSHEFNNPLAILKGIAQMLGMYRRDDLPGDLNDLIGRIPPVVDRLGQLTKRLHNITEVKVTEYGHGVTMLDIEESPPADPPPSAEPDTGSESGEDPARSDG